MDEEPPSSEWKTYTLSQGHISVNHVVADLYCIKSNRQVRIKLPLEAQGLPCNCWEECLYEGVRCDLDADLSVIKRWEDRPKCRLYYESLKILQNLGRQSA